MQVREHNVLGPYVEGLSQLCVLDAQEIEDLMIGEKITLEYFAQRETSLGRWQQRT